MDTEPVKMLKRAQFLAWLSKCALGLIFLAGSVACATAGTSECSEAQARTAENEIAGLDSWKAVHGAYQKYIHCDDGSVAEGYSEAIARLLVDRWQTITDLQKIVQRDSKFLDFVASHVDETLDERDLNAIHLSAATECPPMVAAVCSRLAKEAAK